LTGLSAGTYSYKATGCGATGSGSVSVNGTSNYMITFCPPSSGTCCGSGLGCGSGGAKRCSICGGSVKTTDFKITSTKTGNLISGGVDDKDSIGFDVFRSEKGKNIFEKINKSLTPFSGSGSIRFLDKEIESGRSYVYKVEIVGNKGTRKSCVIE